MKTMNLKNIAISSLIAVSTCFAMVGTANAAPQPDTHHLTQKQKNAIAAKQKAKHHADVKAKQKAKHKTQLRAKAKHKAESKHHSNLKAKQKANQKKAHHDNKFKQNRKNG